MSNVVSMPVINYCKRQTIH